MDIIDYVNWGFIGCSEFKNSDYFSIPEQNFDDMITTFFATRDANAQSIYNLILGTKGTYFAHNYPNNDYPTTCIDAAGKQRFVDAVKNIYEKQFDFHKKALIFWNALTPPSLPRKQTGIVEYTGDFSFKALETYNDFDNPYWGFSETDYTIDYTDKQTLTREIYEDYINSLADYLFSFKSFMKVVTDSDFEEFIPPTT